MLSPEDFDAFLNAPVGGAHEFEVDLTCLVTTNYRLTMEGINRAEEEEIAAIDDSLKDEVDREIVSSIRGDYLTFYDDLRSAARCLAVVALVTRFHHWIIVYSRRIDSKRKEERLEKNMRFLNKTLGKPQVDVDFFMKLAEVRHSVIHADSRHQWTDQHDLTRQVDARYSPKGYRVEVSDADIAEATAKAIRQIKWYDERLRAIQR